MNNILEELTENLRMFGGVGEKTAKRYAYELLEVDEKRRKKLIESILKLDEIKKCTRCFNYATEELCGVCQSIRDEQILVVVATPKDVMMLENVLNQKYYYHILGGIISPMQEIDASDLNIKELKVRLNDRIKEIILVLPTTIEGEMTANYIKEILKEDVKVTKLAQGIPIGGNLEYVDEVTLMRSLEGRK